MWILLALLAVSTADVIVLTDETFEHDTQVTTGSTTGDWLVLFYAPWCGHCKKVKPIWEDLAKDLGKETIKSASVAMVDCDENDSTCMRFGIRGYPTILYFRHGKMYKYSGGRTLENFKQFLDGGFEKVSAEAIPAELGAFDKFKTHFGLFMKDLDKTLESGFQEFGYGHLSKAVKISITVSIFVLPAFLIACCIFSCGGGSEEETEGPKISKPKNFKKNKID